MSKRTTIIFDMDGLMVDTEPLSRRAWTQLLGQYGFELQDEIYVRMIGRRSDVSAQIVLDMFDLPLTAKEITMRKEEIFDGIRAGGVVAMPGLMELQEELARRGLPWAVATSSPRRHAEIILNQLGLSGACQAIAAGDEVAHGKPAPDIYSLAARRMGVSPAKCLALEDSQPGCQAAVAAGMAVIAIPNGQTRVADFSDALAICDTLHEVVDNLDALLEAG